MAFPTDEAGLKAAGYRFIRSDTCRGQDCHEPLEFWETPSGKLIPLNASDLQAHFATCPNADQFRRGKKES